MKFGQIAKRVSLLVVVNILVMLTITVVLSILRVNRYLPQRPRRANEGDVPADRPVDAPRGEALDPSQLNPLLRWLDRALSR